MLCSFRHLLAVVISQTVQMILRVLGGSSQVFCRMLYCLNLSDVFIMIDTGVMGY